MKKNGPYKIISTKKVYKNPWVDVTEDKVIFPNGKKGLFGIIKIIQGSSVLAINSKMEAYLVREYKYGIRKDSIEVMSGGFETGDNPLSAAKRELKEELGLKAKKWVNLGRVDPFTTVVNSPNFMFLALGIKKTKLESDNEENLSFFKVPFKTALNWVIQGKITHSASCVLILKAAKYLDNNSY